MKLTFGILASWFVFSSAASFGIIRETSKMSEVWDAIEPGTLVLFDIDNTLLEAAQTLGTDQWLRYRIAKEARLLIGSGEPEEKAKVMAYERIFPLWKRVQRVTAVKGLEKDLGKKIAQLKGQVAALALTARPADLAEVTVTQLKSVGIELNEVTPTKQEGVLKPNANIDLVVRLHEGILFSGNNPKGKVLVDWLIDQKLLERFKKIIFVDDREENVKSVEAALDDVMPAAQHLSFRYGLLDEKVKSLNPALVDFQELKFNRPLSDEEAEKLLEARPN